MVPNRFFGSLPNSSQQENSALPSNLSADAKLDLIISGLTKNEAAVQCLQNQNDIANNLTTRYVQNYSLLMIIIRRSIEDMQKSIESLSNRVKHLEESKYTCSSSNTETKACIKCPKELSVIKNNIKFCNNYNFLSRLGYCIAIYKKIQNFIMYLSTSEMNTDY